MYNHVNTGVPLASSAPFYSSTIVLKLSWITLKLIREFVNYVRMPDEVLNVQSTRIDG